MKTESAISEHVTPELAREFANTLLDAWDTGNQDRLFEHIADDVEYWDDALPAPIHGKEQARGFFDAATEAISEFDATLLDGPALGLDRPIVMIHFRYGGRLTGDFGELKANNKSWSVDGASLYEFRHGKVVRWRAMYNVAEMLRQLEITVQP